MQSHDFQEWGTLFSGCPAWDRPRLTPGHQCHKQEVQENKTDPQKGHSKILMQVCQECPALPTFCSFWRRGSCRHCRDIRAGERQDVGNTIPCIASSFLSNLYVHKVLVVLQLVPCSRIISGLQQALLHFGLPTVQPRILMLGKAEPTKCTPDYLMLCPVLGR